MISIASSLSIIKNHPQTRDELTYGIVFVGVVLFADVFGVVGAHVGMGVGVGVGMVVGRTWAWVWTRALAWVLRWYRRC